MFFGTTPLAEHVEQSTALSRPGPCTSDCVKMRSDRAQSQKQSLLLAASLPDINGQAPHDGSMRRLGCYRLKPVGHCDLTIHYCGISEGQVYTASA